MIRENLEPSSGSNTPLSVEDSLEHVQRIKEIPNDPEHVHVYLLALRNLLVATDLHFDELVSKSIQDPSNSKEGVLLKKVYDALRSQKGHLSAIEMTEDWQRRITDAYSDLRNKFLLNFKNVD